MEPGAYYPFILTTARDKESIYVLIKRLFPEENGVSGK